MFSRKLAFIITLAVWVVIAFLWHARLAIDEARFEIFKASADVADRVLTVLSIVGLLWTVHLVLSANAAKAKFIAIIKIPGMDYTLHLPNARSAFRVLLTSNERTIIMRSGDSTPLNYEELHELAKLEEDEIAKLE